MSRRNLKYTIKKRTYRVTSEFDRIINGLGIPIRRNSGSEQGLHFRGYIEHVVVEGVEKRLDAEAITSSKHRAVRFIPNDKSKLAAQSVYTLGTEILI